MPTSFKVLYDSHRQKDILVASSCGSPVPPTRPLDSVKFSVKNAVYQVSGASSRYLEVCQRQPFYFIVA
jgi:hypothetical protein